MIVAIECDMASENENKIKEFGRSNKF